MSSKQIRAQVRHLDDDGMPVAQIARRLAIAQAEVIAILDDPEAEPKFSIVEAVKEQQPAFVERVREEIKRIEDAATTYVPPQTPPVPWVAKPNIVVPAAPRPELSVVDGPSAQPTTPFDDCGTTTAYARHYARHQKPCDRCREAYNAAGRARTAEKNKGKPEPWGRHPAQPPQRRHGSGTVTRIAPAEPPPLPAPAPVEPKRTGAPTEHGTYAGFQRHTRNNEVPCEECRQGKRDYQKRARAKKKGAPPVKVQERVRWLVPRGVTWPDGTKAEYGTLFTNGSRDSIETISAETAERWASFGAVIYTRLVTEWKPAQT